ncbi:hypothetical protein SAMN00120144_0779 [Hymenobacter roseosalivarius DSM 11622]|uniref:Uncharacterized protein n=1 Tax=Hymenobacter roseosalivarius DSM 11622 TaxID=645990 RepID=A0A1W1URZ4_9BACT|nr:hypothetical protein [Hymenobacter roseosalivarius]SMB83847.1 hypothetical protein SAMN00120144_0779 [Hymenobacter roseosalivarius DSM 11622]
MTPDGGLDQLEALLSDALTVLNRHTAQLKQHTVILNQHITLLNQLVTAMGQQSGTIGFLLRE